MKANNKEGQLIYTGCKYVLRSRRRKSTFYKCGSVRTPTATTVVKDRSKAAVLSGVTLVEASANPEHNLLWTRDWIAELA